jgi:hypothetical protein
MARNCTLAAPLLDGERSPTSLMGPTATWLHIRVTSALPPIAAERHSSGNMKMTTVKYTRSASHGRMEHLVEARSLVAQGVILSRARTHKRAAISGLMPA